jgi:hypothetical protein
MFVPDCLDLFFPLPIPILMSTILSCSVKPILLGSGIRFKRFLSLSVVCGSCSGGWPGRYLYSAGNCSHIQNGLRAHRGLKALTGVVKWRSPPGRRFLTLAREDM